MLLANLNSKGSKDAAVSKLG